MRPVVVFTDGACSGNPGPGGWAAIVSGPDGAVRELGGHEPRTTNNRMELISAICALRECEARYPGQPVLVHSDSEYVVNGAARWIAGWMRKGWKTAAGTAVKNKDLWMMLATLLQSSGLGPVQWLHVMGHSGNAGNERCDRIAVQFAFGTEPPLYDGPSDGYRIPIAPVTGAGLPAREPYDDPDRRSSPTRRAPLR